MLLLVRYLIRWWRRRRELRRPQAPEGGAPTPPTAAVTGEPAVAPQIGARRPPAPRGSLALLVHQLRFELLIAFRNPRARFVTIVFPVVMLVIFAGVFHGTTTVAGIHVKLSRYFLAGIFAMSIVLAGYANLVVAIATLRDRGVLKRRRAAPVPAAILIGAQALSAVLTVAVMGAILLVLAKLFYGIALAPGAIAAMACTAVLGGLAFASIGYAVSGLIGSADAAQPIVQATTMPLWFISGVLIPTQNLSGAVRSIGSVFPIEPLAAGMHLATVHATFAKSISIGDLLVLAAWGVGAVAVAVWRFSWLPAGAGR